MGGEKEWLASPSASDGLIAKAIRNIVMIVPFFDSRNIFAQSLEVMTHSFYSTYRFEFVVKSGEVVANSATVFPVN